MQRRTPSASVSASVSAADATSLARSNAASAVLIIAVLVTVAVGVAARPAPAQDSRPDVLVLRRPTADQIRKDWPQIIEHLRQGGSLVQLGGAPFSDAPEYARRLLIGPAELVPSPTDARVVVASEYEGPLPAILPARALTVRFTTLREFKDEDGTSGPRDAVLRPLAHILDAEGVPRSAPIVEIDRLRGPYAGGRWIFLTTDGEVPAALESALIARARSGPADLTALPARASIGAGDAARFAVSRLRPARPGGVSLGGRAGAEATTAPDSAEASFTVKSPNGREMNGRVVLRGQAAARSGTIEIPGEFSATPGLYRVVVTTKDGAEPSTIESGFRVRDAEAAVVPPLGVSRDWLTRSGKPVPIVGTTYMASDVHRKFLFEPNPVVFDRDFALMRKSGINFVRTGIWTGWSRAMLDVGAMDDAVLSALEAYVDSAAAHDIDVCFTFFAFQPPMFGGVNPYLDPRALEGQKAWIRAVAGRLRGKGRVHYDLINEPSYSPADQLWTNRPIGDTHEAAAWRSFLDRRYGRTGASPQERAARLRLAHGDSGDDPYVLPTTNDQSYTMVRENRSPRRAVDFGAFTNAVVAGWADALRREIRSVAGQDTLVTLGQDEGGTENRPAQLLHAHAVDYTSLHNWWKNDDLLFDGLATKAEGVPNLVSETGLMRLEDHDGVPWRSPEAAARLLERKCALAFGARGAGVVQWAWNINPYMPIDNESTIGIWRPDGTAKPEYDVLRRFASFANRAAPALADFEPAEVVVVLPLDRAWSGRTKGLDGAKRLVRVLADRFGVAVRCAPSSAAGDVPGRPPYGPLVKLSLHTGSEFFDADSDVGFDPSEVAQCTFVPDPIEPERKRLTFGPLASSTAVEVRASAPVSLREPTAWVVRDGAPMWVTFDQNYGEWLRKSSKRGVAPNAGTVHWHEPLPLEFAREEEPLHAVLASALLAAKVEHHSASQPMTATVLKMPRSVLVTVVNESSVDGTRRVRIGDRDVDLVVQAGRARCVLYDRDTGAVVADSDAKP